MSDGDPQPLLLKQYEYLRSEIIQCIYLRQVAVIGLFTSFGAAIGALLGWKGLMLMAARAGVLGLVAAGAAFVANCFGALYLHEQSRNRRACSLNKAVEWLATGLAWSEKQTCQGFLIWENYITSDVFKRHNVPFYVRRTMALGLPIVLFTVPTVLGFQLALPLWTKRSFVVWRDVLLSWSFLSCILIAAAGAANVKENAGEACAAAQTPASQRDSLSRWYRVAAKSWPVRRFCGSLSWLVGSAWGRLVLCLAYVSPAVALLTQVLTRTDWLVLESSSLQALAARDAIELAANAESSSPERAALALSCLAAIGLGLWAMRTFVGIATKLADEDPKLPQVLDWLAEQGIWLQSVFARCGWQTTPLSLPQGRTQSSTDDEALARAIEAWSGWMR